MDGTGKLFEPLLKHLPKQFSYHVICLNSLTATDPEDQVIEIASQLDDEEIIILSESYSGFIAYKLSLHSNLNIRHVIFAASFLETPSKLIWFRKLIPLNIIRSGLIPACILGYLLFADARNKELVKLLLSTLTLVSNSTLKQRLDFITYLTRPSVKLSTPCTYIQASTDYLINKKSVNAFTDLCTNIKVVNLKGGHFIVQSHPQYFSQLIRDLTT